MKGVKQRNIREKEERNMFKNLYLYKGNSEIDCKELNARHIKKTKQS